MNITKNYHYEKDYDCFQIYSLKEGEKVERNYMFGDIVICVTNEGKVVGLDMQDFSSILKESGIDPRILDNLHDAKLGIKDNLDSVFISIEIFIEENNLLQKKIIPITRLPKEYLD